jgi:lambda family phage tail tape measure protein
MAANIRATLQLDTKDAQKGVKGVGTALKALATGAVAKGIFDLGNQFQEIQNKLKAVTNSSEGTAQAFASVAAIAKSTRSDLGATADLYFRLSKSAENLNLTQGETARVTELFAKTLKNSGATATESASAILQFGQAMASGKLAGDEFRSLNETNSDLMDRLAKAMGKPRGELKKLASEGKITAKIIANALLESGDAIETTFGKTSVTLGESLTMIRNEFTVLVGKLETQFGLFSKIAGAIALISENLTALGIVLGTVFAVKTISSIIKMVKAIQALQIATKAQAVAQAALLALSGPAGWGLLAGAAVATGAAVVALNKTFEGTDKAINDAIDSVDRQAGSTATLVEESEKLTEEEKERKAAADELARITKQQAEAFKSQLADLQTGSKEFATQLELRRAMLGATEEEKSVLEAIGDIEEDRADAIKELNELTTISAEDRLTLEGEINTEYDDRISKTKAQLALEENISKEIEQRQNKRAGSDEFALMAGSLMNLQESYKIFDLDKRERQQKTFEESQKQAVALQELEDKFADLKYEKETALGRLLNDEEKTALEQQKAEELKALLEIQSVRTIGMELYLNQLDQAREKTNTMNHGMMESFAEFARMVNDKAAYGARIFDTMTKGFESAIVSFVETGKLSFKDLFKSLMVEIIKMQANKIFLALFSPTGMFGDLFAGLFDKGGLIPGGKFGIAGENGPELINGPARVTSTASTAEILGRKSGPTQVTYNINAIDSRSFEARLAENPEYLYNVTQVGARRQPR